MAPEEPTPMPDPSAKTKTTTTDNKTVTARSASRGSLMRRLQRYNGNMATEQFAPLGRSLNSPRTAREMLEEEQDRRRFNFAEQIVLTGVEGADPRTYVSIAEQALHAALLLYPELPPDEGSV